MIIGSELGIGYDPGQHAAYAASWIQVLESEPLAIFRAAADGEKSQGLREHENCTPFPIRGQ